jgi:hypothetical protein
MKKILLPLFVLLSITLAAQVKEKKIRKYAATIKAKELKEKLSIVASAEMEGRETATPGQKRAAAYIESKFRSFGLLPGNGNSYQQVYPVYQDSLTAFSFMVNGTALEPNKEYVINASSIPSGNWKVDNVYFIGTGMLDTTIDVKDKWVVTDAGSFMQQRQKFGFLRRKQVKGVLMIDKSLPRPTPFSMKGNMYRESNASEIPFISVSYGGLSRILNKKLDSAAVSTLAKEGYATNLAVSVSKQKLNLESSNVLGVLPGTDKKDEYVFVTGHYDHLGIRNGMIYYGADDDGSGTTSVLQIAEAFAKAKKKGHGPRRTMVFMTVSGEEEGLWGSEYYTDHPLFPLDKTTVDLNIDMVGRIDPKYKGDSMNYVYVIGEDKLSSDLMPITDSLNKNFTNNIELDRKYNDITDPNRFYYRSDHYNFAKKGVPIIFYFDGVHADYHRPTDTVDKINFDLMEKRVRLVFYTAWDMANRNAMLKRDIPLNVPPRTGGM